jgi:hypothetical protein
LATAPSSVSFCALAANDYQYLPAANMQFEAIPIWRLDQQIPHDKVVENVEGEAKPLNFFEFVKRFME